MIDYISNILLTKLKSQNLIEEGDEEIHFYGFQLLIATVFKGIGLILVAALFDLIKETTLFIIFFSSLRIQAGGVHAKSFIKCFILTMLIAFTGIWVVGLIPKQYALNLQLVAIVISITLVYLYAPVETENKPLTKDEVLIYRKRSMITVMLGSVVIMGFTYLNEPGLMLGNIATMGFLTESITLTPLVQSKISKLK